MEWFKVKDSGELFFWTTFLILCEELINFTTDGNLKLRGSKIFEKSNFFFQVEQIKIDDKLDDKEETKCIEVDSQNGDSNYEPTKNK